MVGGPGEDAGDYSERHAAVTVSSDDQADDGEADEYDDVASDVEDLIGGSGDDLLVGNAGDGLLDGGPGDDDLDGGAGADRLVGGPGVDAVDYSQRAAAMSVSFNGIADDGGAEDNGPGGRDLVSATTEIAIGGSGPDVFVGSAQPEVFVGLGGADSFSGNGGEDAVSYVDRSTGVTATLGDGQANDGNDLDGPPMTRDNIKPDIEDVIGGSGPDAMTGDGASNLLVGLDGDDRLDSRDGAGIDSDDCGAGSDLALIDRDDDIFDCESINPASPGPGPAASAAAPAGARPAVSAAVSAPRLAFRGSGQLRLIRSRAFTLRLVSDKAARVAVCATVAISGAHPRHLRVRSSTVQLTAGRESRVRLALAARPYRTILRALRHRQPVRLRVVVRGGSPVGVTQRTFRATL
jgi:Ca2+-binding RTX toxin-like protein